MKQLILLFLLLVGVMLFVYWSAIPGNLDKFVNNETKPTPTTTADNRKIVTINGNNFEVEIVSSEEGRKTGLSKYDSLDENRGMLFVFEQKEVRPAFWMKGMKFPIDIIWIKDGKVKEITEDVPTLDSNTTSSLVPTYSPKSNVNYVLELKAGVVKSKGIKVGNSVSLPNLSN